MFFFSMTYVLVALPRAILSEVWSKIRHIVTVFVLVMTMDIVPGVK